MNDRDEPESNDVIEVRTVDEEPELPAELPFVTLRNVLLGHPARANLAPTSPYFR